MIYAVSAVTAGKDLDYFVDAAHEQAGFFSYTNREIGALLKGPSCVLHTSPADRFMLKFIQATNMTRDIWFLGEMARLQRSQLQRLWKMFANQYNITPTLRALVWDIAHSSASRFSAKEIMLAVEGGEDAHIRTHLLPRVRRAFERLIEIGIDATNPESQPRDIQIFFEPSTIEFEFRGVTETKMLLTELSSDDSLLKLGWQLELRSTKVAGVKVTLTPHAGDLVNGPLELDNPHHLSVESVLPFADITQGAEVLLNAEPFAFYKSAIDDGRPMLDVSASPLYHNIARAHSVAASLLQQKHQ
jgi:hypothetical protein